MSRTPLHALVWSKEQRLYEWYTQGQIKQRFQPAEESAWLAWLHRVSSFAFRGISGSLNVHKEQRPRGGAYWYAYQTKEGRTRKRYLGRTEALKFSRLEETARTLLHVLSPATTTGQGMLVLSGQLAPPRLPSALVERERLLTALDEAHSTQLTLLSASAGWGKTTLLSVWVQRQKKSQVAWLALDELDNSPTRFWVALIAALRHCPSLAANFGENVVAQLQSPQPPPLSSCLSVLLYELESQQMYPAPIVLIVDDYQVIEESVIHQGMAFFLEHMPAHMHLILSSRVDPDLPLARLRAHGQLTEIRVDELRFQKGEASKFLGKMLSPPLSEEELQRLVSRTEGWIAGLHLVALTMQKREDRSAYLETLTGSQRYLLDYVQEDILARLSPETRNFLLHIAILSRLDAAVCQAVTAAPTMAASQHLLALLERANLFLVPLDEERRTYRLHGLFREALLSALHTHQPEMVPLLHHRAAEFYEAEKQWTEAITHALAGASYSMAARLMEQTVEQFWMRGETATMARWVLALPDPLVREHTRLVLTTALYRLHPVTTSTPEQRESRYQQVKQLIARVEATLQHQAHETSQATHTDEAFRSSDLGTHEASPALLHRRLRLLRAGIALYEAIETSAYERLPALHQEMQELDQDKEIIWHMLPLFCNVVYSTLRQERAKLLPQLLEARQMVRHAGSHFAATRVIQWLALAAVEAGQLRLAYQESLAALDLIEQAASYALLKGYFKEVLALVAYQWNRLEEARSWLRTVIQDATLWQQHDLLLSGYLHLMQVELARGDLSAVQQTQQELEQLGGTQRLNWLPIIQAQWCLAQGQIKEATNWAMSMAFPERAWDRSLYDAFPVVIRIYFAQQHWAEALELLKRFSGDLGSSANSRITLTYLAQHMVALHHAGHHEQANEIAARLFDLTEPEGYLRVYLDEGEPMRQTLEALLSAHSQQQGLAPSIRAYISKLLAVFAQARQITSPSLAEPTPRPALSSASDASLTRREQEVLRLLATGASNQEIARTLVIELPTVKKHVSNLLGKLQASSRTQAISRARALSLL
ncbi:LuxR family transcriptional regulator [Ktedonosporobacter rubrisoli]|uniref:LuxR family transcriptional regulator n=1 Tax=Ktedonosporobacter rubrisoli TaxID=2509675 RepID=A0A4P6K4X9_KTERU|nr:LuxR C-terminal-related transcriptional regulator [Ktedonosporobacter rubrisoli]QBD82900.1 LuxR family transcriptional regulator [Ktedonosporobacter rubrisoli]